MERSTGRLTRPNRKRGSTSAALPKGIVALLLIAFAPISRSEPQLPTQSHKEPLAEDQAFEVQDARLNVAYESLAALMGDTDREALRDEERRWIRGRDRVCARGTSDCMLERTAKRADDLERRVGGLASMVGDWGYRTDCNFGHYPNLTIPNSGGGTAVGEWADGTRLRGSRGSLQGEWRHSRLYVRFCEDEDWGGGHPICPVYGPVEAYMELRGEQLVWFRSVGLPEGKMFREYVTLSRRPRFGGVPSDNDCDDSGEMDAGP